MPITWSRSPSMTGKREWPLATTRPIQDSIGSPRSITSICVLGTMRSRARSSETCSTPSIIDSASASSNWRSCASARTVSSSWRFSGSRKMNAVRRSMRDFGCLADAARPVEGSGMLVGDPRGSPLAAGADARALRRVEDTRAVRQRWCGLRDDPRPCRSARPKPARWRALAYLTVRRRGASRAGGCRAAPTRVAATDRWGFGQRRTPASTVSA